MRTLLSQQESAGTVQEIIVCSTYSQLALIKTPDVYGFSTELSQVV